MTRNLAREWSRTSFTPKEGNGRSALSLLALLLRRRPQQLHQRLRAQAALALGDTARDRLVGEILDLRLVAFEEVVEQAAELVAGGAGGFALQHRAQTPQRHLPQRKILQLG